MYSAGLFTLWLALGPPSGPAEQVLVDLERATSTLGEVKLWESFELLEHSIAAAEQEPRALLDDPRFGDQLYQARIALVWAHLAAHDQASAIVVMDEALRSSGGRPLPQGFGPEVEDLYAARVAATNEVARAQLVVVCNVPCEVLVNERLSGGLTGVDETLPFGTYRVWVLAVRDQVEPLNEDVVLGSEEKPVDLVFGSLPAIEDERPPTSHRASAIELKKIRRMKIAGGVLIGLTALTLPVAITGLVFLSYANSPNCTSLDCLGYALGGATLTMGGVAGTIGFLVPGSIVLAIGKQKERRLRLQTGMPTFRLTPHQTGLGWTLRF